MTTQFRDNKGNQLKSALVALALAATVACENAQAVAILDGSLGLSPGNPDLFASSQGFAFDGTSFSISSTDFSSLYLNNGGSVTSLGGSFSLTGTLSGGDATASFLTSDGWLNGSTLTAMSYENGVFQFLFEGITGTYASIFGTEVGLIYSSQLMTGYTHFADITTGFTNIDTVSGFTDADGTVDTFSVPLPGTLSLGLLGLAGLIASRRSENS